MIEQLKALEEYLKANKMEKTLQSLKVEILAKYPQGPSTQFLNLLDESGPKKLGKSTDFTSRPPEPRGKSKA